MINIGKKGGFDVNARKPSGKSPESGSAPVLRHAGRLRPAGKIPRGISPPHIINTNPGEPELSMIRKISFRLGMEGGLYIGICLGALLAAALISGLILLLSPGTDTVLIVLAALILASLAAAAIVISAQKKRENAPDQLCTCRYRSSLYTLCRECALKENGTRPSDRSEQVRE